MQALTSFAMSHIKILRGVWVQDHKSFLTHLKGCVGLRTFKILLMKLAEFQIYKHTQIYTYFGSYCNHIYPLRDQMLYVESRP